MTSPAGRNARATKESAQAATDVYPPMFPGGNRIGPEEEEAVLRVVRSKRLFRYYGTVDGPSEVEAFELALAQLLSSRHALAVGSGTLALMTALAAAGVGRGDHVIVPAYTWVSTAAAALAVGAIPVIAEVDETLTLDIEDAERRITDRTKAIVPVHMRGAPADMDGVRQIADRHGLVVVEDAAQAIGGSFGGRRLGTIGDLGCFSLQYNKIITCGEGGVVVTDDPLLHDRALMFHDVAATHRKPMGDTPAFFGVVCRMSELQGAVAAVQLRRMDSIIEDCRTNRARIIDTVGDTVCRHGFRLRPCHDEEGDTGIALVLQGPDASRAGLVATALRASGTPARILFEPDRRDLHVAYHWTPIIEKRDWVGATSRNDDDAGVTYGPDCWARTTEVLARSVQVDVSPDLTDAQIERMSRSIRGALARH